MAWRSRRGSARLCLGRRAAGWLPHPEGLRSLPEATRGHRACVPVVSTLSAFVLLLARAEALAIGLPRVRATARAARTRALAATRAASIAGRLDPVLKFVTMDRLSSCSDAACSLLPGTDAVNDLSLTARQPRTGELPPEPLDILGREVLGGIVPSNLDLMSLRSSLR